MQIKNQPDRFKARYSPVGWLDKLILVIAAICLCPCPVWAGPYSGGQFAIYGLYVFLYLALPAILILAIAKTLFWHKLTSEAPTQGSMVFKFIASAALAAGEFFMAAVIATIVSVLASQIPDIAEMDKYTIWVAVTGWLLFFAILARIDVANNRWLLKLVHSKNPGMVFPEKAIYAGAAGLWLALGMLALVLFVINLW